MYSLLLTATADMHSSILTDHFVPQYFASLRDLCVVIPVHFLCTLSTFMILKLFLPTGVAALAPISYSDTHAWFAVSRKSRERHDLLLKTFLTLVNLYPHTGRTLFEKWRSTVPLP